jgi:hypothetical protein
MEAAVTLHQPSSEDVEQPLQILRAMPGLVNSQSLLLYFPTTQGIEQQFYFATTACLLDTKDVFTHLFHRMRAASLLLAPVCTIAYEQMTVHFIERRDPS